MLPLIILLLGVLAAGAAGAQEPVLRPLGDGGGTELLRNGTFEKAEGERAAGWNAFEAGYSRAAGAGRDGKDALFCENATDKEKRGGVQLLPLKRERPTPLMITGWSKAENVSGSPSPDYSLYVDLEYTDGTPLWGQVATFSTGTHDWEKRELYLVPDKPIASLSLYCLFRGKAGKVWFSDISLREFDPGAGGTIFDGRPVVKGKQSARGRAQKTVTAGGLSLRHDPATLAATEVRLGKTAIRLPDAPAGFLARDNAAGPAVYAFERGRCPALGLSLEARCEPRGDALFFEGQVRDDGVRPPSPPSSGGLGGASRDDGIRPPSPPSSGGLGGESRDRAITLFFAVPFPRADGRWHDDGRRARALTAGDFIAASGVGAGATGTMSRYPWACVTGPAGGLALGLDMDRPAQFRLFYNADLQCLVLAYDFALVKETKRFPSAAPFRFVLYAADAAWGFRSAAERYQRLFPEFFTVRSKQQGIWMPFTAVSSVQGWQDFGFRYHEGNNDVAWDRANGILAFRYTEPSTYWMGMPKTMPRTREAAWAELQRLAAEGKPDQKRWAQTTLNSVIHDRNGQPQLQLLNAPWCDGAVWGLCPLPEVAGEVNAATLHWNDRARDSGYGAKAKATLDGEYLDSLEGYVTPDLNFRRDHFAAVQAPLTFDTATKAPAIHKGLAVWEFERWMARDVWGMGKLMFANSVPYRFSFLVGYLDVMGTETNWVHEGKYAPAADSQMLQFRTLSGAKPYLLLMNTHYDNFPPEMVERYFQRSLFYGIFPGMFSHDASNDAYFQTPRWYNRDRHLFKRYIPVIRRVAEAGWQPVTLARCEGALVERFGPAADGSTYFTVHNQTEKPVEAALRLDAGAPAAKALHDLLSGDRFPLDAGQARIPLGPDQARALLVVK